MQDQTGRKTAATSGVGMALGVAMGIPIGMLVDNLGFGIAIGLVFGGWGPGRREKADSTEEPPAQSG
jgi:hypothetical protein